MATEDGGAESDGTLAELQDSIAQLQAELSFTRQAKDALQKQVRVTPNARTRSGRLKGSEGAESRCWETGMNLQMSSLETTW